MTTDVEDNSWWALLSAAVSLAVAGGLGFHWAGWWLAVPLGIAGAVGGFVLGMLFGLPAVFGVLSYGVGLGFVGTQENKQFSLLWWHYLAALPVGALIVGFYAGYLNWVFEMLFRVAAALILPATNVFLAVDFWRRNYDLEISGVGAGSLVVSILLAAWARGKQAPIVSLNAFAAFWMGIVEVVVGIVRAVI